MTMMTPLTKIGIDIDGVLLDQITALIDYCATHYNIHFSASDITQYDISQCTSITRDQLELAFSDPLYQSLLSPIPDASKATRELFLMGYERHIVTARKAHLDSITTSILVSNNIHFDKLAVNVQNKLEYAMQHGLTYFVEDSLENALGLSAGLTRVFLMDVPWNQMENLPSNIHRVNGWNEIIQYLANIDNVCEHYD